MTTTSKAREKLVIDPKGWLHREGGIVSALIRGQDGKRCCLGIYLQDNCGVNPEELIGRSVPRELSQSVRESIPDWLIDRSGGDAHVENIMAENDRPDSTEERVREEIRRLFAKMAIAVQYTDEEE